MLVDIEIAIISTIIINKPAASCSGGTNIIIVYTHAASTLHVF